MLMPTSQNLWRGLALFGPVAVVLIAGFFTLPGPASATANVQGPASVTVARAPRALSAPQAKAQEWLKLHPADFSSVRVLLTHTEASDAIVEGPVTPDDLSTTGFKVAGLMSTPSGGMATINGRLYGVGDTVEAGLTVSLIDVKTGKVVLSRSDGSNLVLTWSPWKPGTPKR